MKKHQHPKRTQMTLISLLLPRKYVEILDMIVGEKNRYPNRSEAIRMAIRDLIHDEGFA